MTQTQTVPTKEQANKVLKDICKAFASSKIIDDITVSVNTSWSDNTPPSATWSITNQIILAHYDTRDARGIRQWESVGRKINPDAKPVIIRAPRYYKFKNDKDEEVTGMYFVGIPVFRLEDTTGDPLPECKPKELPPLYDLAEHNGIKVTYGPQRKAGQGGFYSPSDKHIYLCGEAKGSFFHELAHHYDGKFTKMKIGRHVDQEMVAEMTACVLAKLYGEDTIEFSQKYCAKYIGTTDPVKVGRSCVMVLNRVKNVIHSILEDAEKLQNKKIQE